MKNSRNKILAAVVCGVIVGSIGTSIIGDFQGCKVLASVQSEKHYDEKKHDFSEESVKEKGQGKRKGEGKRKGSHNDQGEASLDEVEGVDVATGKYTDGTYEGSASGYASGLKVQVKISGEKITDVQVVSHNETPGFCERAIESVPAEIVLKQSTSIDTVSGATYTSVGIINAVNEALSEAKAQ